MLVEMSGSAFSASAGISSSPGALLFLSWDDLSFGLLAIADLEYKTETFIIYNESCGHQS
jgi:hypothetical protein